MTTTTFTYQPNVQPYTVPSGVTYVTIEASGAEGSDLGGGSAGGNGGYAKGQLIVTPGTVLYVYVGRWTNAQIGGWNGGGDGGSGTINNGGGGGGASDVRLGGLGLANRIIVGGGGGGRASAGISYGGEGGGTSGALGGKGGFSGPYGDAGTQTSGYALGQGGPAFGLSEEGGGGGGGGYWGGHGGHNGNPTNYGTGGNGGSGYVSSLLVPGSTYMQSGLNTGGGVVIITAVATASLAPTPLLPANGGHIINSVGNVFTWKFNPVDPGGTQASANFRYKQHSGDAWTTVTGVATTAQTFTLTASTWSSGNNVEWQIQTVDSNALTSAWSGSFFTGTVAAVTAPTITVPTTGANEFATPCEIDWTLPGGFTQQAYQVQRNSAADGSGIMYTDSGTVPSSAQVAFIPLDPVSGRTDYLRVRYRYLGNWSVWASVSIISQFWPPHSPGLSVVQVAGGIPQVWCTITNAPADGVYSDAIVNDLYRTSPDGGVVRIATNLPAGPVSFLDELPGAGANHYMARAFAASGASNTSDNVDPPPYVLGLFPAPNLYPSPTLYPSGGVP